MESKISDIGSIVINFLRPKSTIKCIETLKAQCPTLNIYVGDQDIDNNLLLEYCNSHNINYIQLPFDCGIGVSRNTLIDCAKRDNCKYIMWGDNDFIYDERLNLNNALKVLDSDNKVGIVGGTVIHNNKVQHYERIVFFSEEYQTACFIPLEYTYPETYTIDEIDYYYCNMTFNFCIARIEIFNHDIRWDDEIKVKFEHSFFFIKFLLYCDLKVAYCPSIMVHHVHTGTKEYAEFRYRVSDGETYARKLGLKTGFSINEASWDHTSQKVFNYKEIAQVSQPIQSALYHFNRYKTEVITPPITEKKVTQQKEFNNLFDIILKLIEKNIHFVLLKESCLEVIRTKRFSFDNTVLCLGTINLPAIEFLLIDSGFTKISENEYQNGDYKIYIEQYMSPTKKILINEIEVSVPMPVIKYLNKRFGSSWSS